jgi:hypothetical protein
LLATIELNLTNGEQGIRELTAEEQKRARVTVRELSEKFLKEYNPPGIKSIVEYRAEARSVHKRRILPTRRWKAAASVTRADVERLRDAQIGGGRLRPNSVSNTLRSLSPLFTWARREGHIDCANLVEGVDEPYGQPISGQGHATNHARAGRSAASERCEEITHRDHRHTHRAIREAIREHQIFAIEQPTTRIDDVGNVTLALHLVRLEQRIGQPA